MRSIGQLLVLLLVVGIGSYSMAQVEKPAPTEKPLQTEKPPRTEKPLQMEVTIGRVLATSVAQVQRILLPLAMAMPEEKYGYAPTNGEFKGVRTFGQQLKHVAATNFIYASSILDEKPPVDVGEEGEGPATLKTKKDILDYLNKSLAYVQKAVATIDAQNIVSPIKNPFAEGKATRLAMVTLIVGHCYDHYGQMVEYLRMNEIVPPASQR